MVSSFFGDVRNAETSEDHISVLSAVSQDLKCDFDGKDCCVDKDLS